MPSYRIQFYRTVGQSAVAYVKAPSREAAQAYGDNLAVDAYKLEFETVDSRDAYVEDVEETEASYCP